MNENEVQLWIRRACEQNGVHGIADKIKVKWSNRMTASMGYASRNAEGEYAIKLSAKLFPRATPPQRIEVVVHEACHIIDSYLSGVRMSHGSGWKRCMRRCGFEPARCHNVNTDGLRTQWLYKCGCRDHKLSTRLHNSITQGKTRVCKSCRNKLEFVKKLSKSV